MNSGQVQSAIPLDAILIEFIRYQHHLGRLRFEPRYGAGVLTRDGEPHLPSHGDSALKWIPLGRAEEIENQIRLYQKYVRRNVKKATLTRVLRTLYGQVWEPIEKALPMGIHTVVISPDAELNFVSFATLLAPDGRFLAEKHEIQYVSTGRDLLWRKSRQPETKSLAIFANPDFGGKPHAPDSKIAKPPETSHDTNLPPLPGAELEARFLKRQAKGWGLLEDLYVGDQASESALDRLKSPKILHLATHGFFFFQSEIRNPKSEILQSPMQRSLLALAGAKNTLDAWAKGRIPPTDNDGVVTAEEVGRLNLQGTWLVVLSACETGSGEARAGEGVMGLRRGFIRAGTENLLMTLWPVGDTQTVQIIRDFYQEAMRTSDAPSALAAVQRNWLIKLRNERGLSMAVRLAGPFILTYQGRAP